MSEALLSVEQLSTRLHTAAGDRDVVQEVSFRCDRGKTYCLVGESGSGKSITAASIMRLLPARLASYPSGRVLFHDTQGQATDLLGLHEEEMRRYRGLRIGMIFQEPMTSLNPVYSLADQLIEGLFQHHPEWTYEQAYERALQSLKAVHLNRAEQRMSAYPHQLSGGQRQRVMIAMAMSLEPELLIADEPTTALDVTVQAEILELIAELQRQRGTGVLFISHDLAVVSQIANDVGVMKQGRLIEQGEAMSVMSTPQQAYTQNLLAALPENLQRPDASPVSEPAAFFEVQDLSVHFPIRKGLMRRTVDVVKAVDGVSVNVQQGEILALVGESGSGKSTLGRALMRLQPMTAGRVRLQGEDISDWPESRLRALRPKMQMVFQDPASSLNPRLSLASVLLELMQQHAIGEDRDERIERAQRLLQRVDLPGDSLWRYPHEFSGGQRQRLGIVRALIVQPQFILCDEITSALDVSVQAEILQLLLQLRDEERLTLLFISHDIAVVDYLADRVAVMQQGKLVELGDTQEILARPQEVYTQRLMNAVPKLQLSA